MNSIAMFVLLGFAAAMPAQSSAAPPAVAAPVPPTAAHVHRVLFADAFDAGAFAAIVRAGEAVVPMLVNELSRGGAFTEPLSAPTARALRALRLLGPEHAASAVRPLLAAVALDISRDDRELLETLAVLVPGLSDRAAFRVETKAIDIVAPLPTKPGGMREFLRWVAKMRGWYRLRQRLAGDLPTDVAVLTQQLEHEDPLHRERAAQLLGSLGQAARSALSALLHVERTELHPRIAGSDVGNLTADFHDLVRDAAAIAIARIDPSAEGAPRGLALLLERADSPQERRQAALALARIASGGGYDPVPALLTATRSDDGGVAGDAITALGQLGRADEAVLVRLRDLSQSDDAGLAARARAALRTLQPREAAGR